jgi:hypothetical protein
MSFFKFGSPKRNNAPSLKKLKHNFGTKIFLEKTKITTHMDIWKYGQIIIIQKSLTIKQF